MEKKEIIVKNQVPRQFYTTDLREEREREREEEETKIEKERQRKKPRQQQYIVQVPEERKGKEKKRGETSKNQKSIRKKIKKIKSQHES